MGMTIEKRDQSQGSQFPIAKEDGLDLTVMGGNLNAANVTKVILPQTLTLVDNDTNYVYIDWDDDTIKANITGIPKDALDLYEITTVGGAVTSIVDLRAPMRMSAHTKFQTKATFLASGDFNSDTGWLTLDLSADAPEGATGVQLVIAVTDSGTPGINVWCAVRKPGETAISQQIRDYPQVSGVYNTLSAPVGMDSNQHIEYKVSVSGTMSVYVALAGWIFG